MENTRTAESNACGGAGNMNKVLFSYSSLQLKDPNDATPGLIDILLEFILH